MLVKGKVCTACLAGTIAGASAAFWLEDHASYMIFAGALLVAAAFSSKTILPTLLSLAIGVRDMLDGDSP